MPRLARLFMPGCPQHIIQRGNNRQVCFFSDMDYQVYLDRLKYAAEKFNVKIHAFVLMTNHVHLLATASGKYDISNMMQSLGRVYVHYINETYNRSGTLWEGRYKSTIVDSENYLLTLYRYIELNPVRAGMVSHPAEYPWSSFRQNAGDKIIQLLTPHTLYMDLGQCELERKQAYLSLFKSELSDVDVAFIRESTNKSWAMSNEKFLKQIASQLNRHPVPGKRGGDRKSAGYRKAAESTNCDDAMP